MRHLWSLLAGVVAAPLTWVLVSMGQGGSTRTVTGWLETRRYDTVDLIEPAAYLAVAGIILGLIGTLRFSPLGPLVAGLLLIAPYAGMFADPLAVRDAVPGTWEVRGDPLPLRLPLDNGTLLLLGALLVMATFSIQRWRRWPGTPAESTPDSTESSGPLVLDGLGSPSSGLDGPVTVGARSGGVTADLAEVPSGGSAVDTTVSGTVSGTRVVEAPRRPTESPWSAPPASSSRSTSESTSDA